MPVWQFLRLFASLLLGVSFVSDRLAAEDWTRFRGPQGSGVAEASVPETWSDSENLAWNTPLPGPGASSPAVHGDRVFLTAYSGYGLEVEDPGELADLKLHVICLALSDGRVLWDRTVDPSPEEQRMGKRVAEHGYATPTPCVDEANVYASFGPSGVVAFTHQGEPLWRQSVGTGTAGFGAAASPIEFQDLVIMNASIEDDAVYGLDKQTGAVRWRTGGIDRSWTTPTIVQLNDGSHELVVNQKGAVLGLEPSTGKRRWSCEAIQDYIVPGIVADGEKLYCSGGRQNKTFALRAGGRGDVSLSHLVWDVPRGANVTTPLLDDGYLYWSHDKALVPQTEVEAI